MAQACFLPSLKNVIKAFTKPPLARVLFSPYFTYDASCSYYIAQPYVVAFERHPASASSTLPALKHPILEQSIHNGIGTINLYDARRPPNAVPVASLGPAQLQGLRNQLAQDVEDLVDSHAQLGRAATRFSTAASAVETLAESRKDQPLLLPLTQSLYVKGKLAETEKVLVNIGTDYFVEMSTEQATAYCRRKTLFLQKQQQALQKVVQEKRGALNQVTNVLQDKMRELQSSQPGSKGSN